MTATPQALAALGMPPGLAGKVGIESPVTLAATGQQQAEAAPITSQVTYVYPVDPDNANFAVRLPPVRFAPYDEYIVCNGGTDPLHTVYVYAAPGDEIAGLGLGGLALNWGYGGMGARFRKLDSHRWLAI